MSRLELLEIRIKPGMPWFQIDFWKGEDLHDTLIEPSPVRAREKLMKWGVGKGRKIQWDKVRDGETLILRPDSVTWMWA